MDPRVLGALDPLEHRRGAETTRSADPQERGLFVAAMEFIGHRRDHACPRRSERVADGDGAAGLWCSQFWQV